MGKVLLRISSYNNAKRALARTEWEYKCEQLWLEAKKWRQDLQDFLFFIFLFLMEDLPDFVK